MLGLVLIHGGIGAPDELRHRAAVLRPDHPSHARADEAEISPSRNGSRRLREPAVRRRHLIVAMTPASTIANSSPPRRATASLSRLIAAGVWPSGGQLVAALVADVSLTSLKSLRSMNSRPTCSGPPFGDTPQRAVDVLAEADQIQQARQPVVARIVVQLVHQPRVLDRGAASAATPVRRSISSPSGRSRSGRSATATLSAPRNTPRATIGITANTTAPSVASLSLALPSRRRVFS